MVTASAGLREAQAAVLVWSSDAPWECLTAPVTSGTAARSAGLLNTVLQQFDVTNNPRYRPRAVGPQGLTTWCSCFTEDATRALGCGIPHVVLRGTAWVELSANGQIQWLASAAGLRNGWRRLAGPEDAYRAANAGRPVVATFYNTQGDGHVAMVMASGSLTTHLLIAQAGRRCFDSEPLESGFGRYPVGFFMHD